jgi:5-methylcytosine-specific restriction endonuclease McrA
MTTAKLSYKEEVFKRDNWTCVYCGYDGSVSAEALRRGHFHVDHFIPRAKGGSNEMDNLVTACGFCPGLMSRPKFGKAQSTRCSIRPLGHGTCIAPCPAAAVAVER